MKIRLNKLVGILLVAYGVIMIVAAIILFMSGRDFVRRLVSGVVPLLIRIGLLYFKDHYFEVGKNNLVTYWLIGLKYKTYHFNSLKDLTIEDDKIFLKVGDKKEKLPIYKWLSDPSDWQALAEMLKK